MIPPALAARCAGRPEVLARLAALFADNGAPADAAPPAPATMATRRAAAPVGMRPGGAAKSWRRAASFVRSMVSGAGGARVDAPTRALRVLSCHGDPAADVPPCPARAYSAAGRFHFCNECGCGAREVARLDAVGSTGETPMFDPGGYDKLDYPHLECPRGRPGFTSQHPVL